MRSRTIGRLVATWMLVAAFGGVFASPLAAQNDKPRGEDAPPPSGKPALQLRLAPLDDLIAGLRHTVKKLDRGEEGKQFEEMLKSRTGPKGLEGVDTKKPIGLIASVNKQLDRSEVLFLLPIADEKTFLSFIDGLDYKPKKEKDGAYSMSLENVPFPILFRFAHGYLYATLKYTATTEIASASKLPKPETALAGGSGLMSLAVHLDAVPGAVRKALVPAAALQLGNLKDNELPGATEKQKELRDGLLDEAMRIGKLLIENGATMRLKADLDRKSDTMALSLHIEGPKGSPLAQEIASLAQRSSLGPAILDKDSVMGGYLNAPIPTALRKLMDPVIDELFETGMKNLEKPVKELLQPIADSVKPTLKTDAVVLGADLRGPGKSGKYTMVNFLRVSKGDAVEKAFKALLEKVPEDAKKALKTDIARVEGVNIHQIDPAQAGDAVKTIGKDLVYAALSKDALFMTGGENGLDAIKAALAVKPASGKLLHLHIAVAKAGPLTRQNAKEVRELSQKVFPGKTPDRVTLTLDAGSRLDLSLSVDLAVLRFAFLLGELDKKKE